MDGEERLTRVYSYCKTGKLTGGLAAVRFDFHHHPCVVPKAAGENCTYAVCMGRQTTLKQYIHKMKDEHGFEKPLMIQMTSSLKHIHDAGKVVTTFTEKNFKFSEDLKYVVLTNFEHTDANSDSAKRANIITLAGLFYSILTGKPLTANKVDREDLVCSQEPAIAAHLIQKMREIVNFSADDVLKHPYFWNSMKTLHFICSVSQLYQSQMARSYQKFRFYTQEQFFAHKELFKDWRKELEVKPTGQSSACYKIDAVKMLLEFDDTHGTSYNGPPQFEILRFIRNCSAHYWDNDQKHRNAKTVFKSENDGLWRFFNDKFPDWFIFAYDLAKRLRDQEDPKRKNKEQTVFQQYLNDPAKILELVHRTVDRDIKP